MPFRSGRVSYCRFRVVGEAPVVVDETMFAKLDEHKFREASPGVPGDIESGWTTGDHLLDTQFSYEKNGFGDMLLMAMRLDSHAVPSDLKHAYRRINEQAAAGQNPSGFASKAQKREAAELAERQIHEDLASGRFRKSKLIPVLWDLRRQTVYSAAATAAAVEQLARLFHQTFGLKSEIITAGSLAGHLLRQRGRGRDYEDLRPSALTRPPAAATIDHEDADGPRDINTPICPWVAQSTDLKDFVGNEFLIWLWYVLEAEEGMVSIDKDEIAITIDKSLDMDCAWSVNGKQTLRGDGPTRLIEAGDALATGKWPRKMGLIVSDGEHQWELALQGDRMTVSAAALPTIEQANSPREIIEMRLQLVRRLTEVLDLLFGQFLAQRGGDAWPAVRSRMARWITDRRAPKAPTPAPTTAPVETP